MKNLLLLGCKFDLDESELTSSPVNASARKAWPNEVASRPKFNFNLRLLASSSGQGLRTKFRAKARLKVNSAYELGDP